jgi:hypothetical protein
VLATLYASPITAQDDARIVRDVPLARNAGGRVLGTLRSGAEVAAGPTRSGWTEVTVEGWIYQTSVGRDVRDGFEIGVSSTKGENLRAEPNGRVVARLRYGALLQRTGGRGNWLRVRRTGWVPRAAVERAVETAAAPEPRRERPAAARARPPAPTPRPRSDTTPPDTSRPIPPPAERPSTGLEESRIQVTRTTALHGAPDAAELGTLQPGVTGRTLSRAGDWVRVQLEGWVRAADIGSPSGGALVGVSAAELRAEPARYVGQTVEWRLQFIAVQEADELRSELPRGLPFLLTRGPLPEPGFVYVTLTRAEADRFRTLPALQEMVVHVKIRAPRTRYLTTPVVELESVVSGLPQ